MENSEPNKLVNNLRNHIQLQIAAGFDSLSSIRESAIEVFFDEADEETLEMLADQLTQEMVDEHFRDQANWPEITDCDRLDDAFVELNQKGIISRQNFSCCGNCGIGEIGSEMRAEWLQGKQVRGFTFYHMQDTDSAASGYGLYLFYGSFQGNELASQQIGEEIVQTLHRHGLQTTWNGQIDTRIHVELDWKRRRPVEVKVS